jgi:hypothetical protein
VNPLTVAGVLRDDYLKLLRTTFAPRQAVLREAFNREVEREGFLTREPFVALAQPYRYGAPITEVLDETRRLFGSIAERPFTHQRDACLRILQGLPTVIATGTGSGKTEAFLLPIVDHCLRHRGEPGPKAVLVYPMNALVNDQRLRVRSLLAGTGVSYGAYTGETPWTGERPQGLPDEERVTRQEFRSSPPDLLLTNYQMLEYLLIRGDGREIFRDHHVRFVVLDEVHTYHGALGTDVAFLVRRLRAAFRQGRPDDPAPLFVGTSATLHGGDGADPRAEVAAFFETLTGQPTLADAVVVEQADLPEPPPGLTLGPPSTISDEVYHAFDPERPDTVLALARALVSRSVGTLEECWEGTLLPYLLLRWFQRPAPVSAAAAWLAERPERNGVSSDALLREIEAALLVGPCLPESHPLRLRPRIHQFMRGLARFWRCTNPDCGRLLGEGEEECPKCGSRTLPLALCRTCGWDFFISVGPQEADGLVATLVPWLARGSTRRTLFVYDPPAAEVPVDPEDLPSEGEEDSEDVPAGAPAEPEAGPDADGFLCPRCLVVSEDPARRLCTCSGAPLRPVRFHGGRGTRCPVCHSRYGRYDVLTPVSLGNSSALTHIARTLMRELPESQRRLLIFTDSRQDAAHQARFIEGVEAHLRLRRSIYRLLRDSPSPHDLTWLVEQVYHDHVEQGFLERTRQPDQRRRDMDLLTGSILHEFVIAPLARPSLERLGLVGVGYAGLADELAQPAFEALCREHGLDPDRASRAVRLVLDTMRRNRAVAHEVLRTRLSFDDRLARQFGIAPGRQVGLPLAFLPPGARTRETRTYELRATWNRAGARAGTQAVWGQTLGDRGTDDAFAAVFEWLEDRGFIRAVSIGRNANEVTGFQIPVEMLQFESARTFARCSACGHVEVNTRPGGACPRYGCVGHMAPWEGALAEGNLNALLVQAETSPVLVAQEHSAVVTDERRVKIEEQFKATPPRVNVLACTPTLELGINIGDLEAAALRNIPPRPANYAQRTGRIGRRSRMGIAVGFSRNTPHDGYFFDHPDEMITGAISAPRFNAANMEALARHLRSLVLEEARVDFPANLAPYLTEEGEIDEANVGPLIRQVEGAQAAAIARALEVFAGVGTIPRPWVESVITSTGRDLREALERRGRLIASAVRRMRELGQKVAQSPRDREAEQGFRNMANRLRLDFRYAYLPRVLAEEGLLPGYAFPGDPGSLALGHDAEPIFASRTQAQREYCPGQIVYARGRRWHVKGLALHRPGSLGRTRSQERFAFTLCPNCQLANPAGAANNCLRCNTLLDEGTQVAVDAGAFQAWPAEVEPESEEERALVFFDVRAHPQRDVPGTAFALGPWHLELRRQENIWWINHGPLERALDPGPSVRAAGFRLCLTCGEHLPPSPPPAPDAQGRGRRRSAPAAPQAQRDSHADRCSGTPEHLVLGHQARADTLRLVAAGLEHLGEEGVAWAWSFAYAIVEGASRVFEIDGEDLEPLVLTRRVEGEGESREAVMEIAWVDRTIGGSDILENVAARFPDVAAAAVRHLEGHDCAKACYRCLMTYRNQRVHRLLDWRLVWHHLEAAARETIEPRGEIRVSPHVTEGPEWDEARREGCESPQELRLLRAIRAAGLLEPEKQYLVEDERGIPLVRADFAYFNRGQGRGLLIFVDGLKFHSSMARRLHDARQTQRLQKLGYSVLRFWGTQVNQKPMECAETIKILLGSGC